MIVRKLRAKKGWSQEQLADFSGLSVRTIQRVEKGQKASIETLKCIASVFEVDISTLTEDITVIDKESDDWKKLPWWFRFNMFGIGTRRQLLIFEYLGLAIGLMYWAIGPNPLKAPLIFIVVYITSWLVRYGDKKEVWS